MLKGHPSKTYEMKCIKYGMYIPTLLTGRPKIDFPTDVPMVDLISYAPGPGVADESTETDGNR